MLSSSALQKSIVRLATRAAVHEVHYFDRPGPGRTILFIHGLGNASDNFAELSDEVPLLAHRLIAIDLPGCGDTPYVEGPLHIDDLVELVQEFVGQFALRDFVLVGASMGGLIALLFAERHPELLTGFVNVEGNLAPEDCSMGTRIIVGHDYDAFEREGLPQMKASLRARSGRGFAKHLDVLERATPRALYDYSFSTVDYSDNGRLIERFLALPLPLYFVYGAANDYLSYLPRLRESHCTVIEIPNADHFLFYDNPSAFAAALARAAI